MNVLVTGGAGFIGSHLVDGLVAEGHHVRVLDNLEEPTHKKNVLPSFSEGVEFIRGDIANPKDVEGALIDIDAIFHLAATGGFSADILRYITTNTSGTAVMLDIIQKQRLPIKKIIVASSVAVYGEGKYGCGNEIFYPSPRPLSQLRSRLWDMLHTSGKKATPLPTDEQSPVSPRTVYGITKYDQERLVLSVGKHLDIPATALRFFVTYGPRQSLLNPYTGVCSIFSTRILNNKPPVVYEDGMQSRDFVYVSDVVQACLLVLKKNAANDKTFNVGTGTSVSIKELATHLISAYGKSFEPQVSNEFRPGDVRHIIADISEIKKLGYRPTVGIREGLEKYIEWIKSQKNISDYFSDAQESLKKQQVVLQAP